MVKRVCRLVRERHKDRWDKVCMVFIDLGGVGRDIELCWVCERFKLLRNFKVIMISKELLGWFFGVF
uniref:hypothetical protein n=1 Tax=Bacillus subtilis TaxID=1423 RepID=UPI001BDB9670